MDWNIRVISRATGIETDVLYYTSRAEMRDAHRSLKMRGWDIDSKLVASR